MYTDLLVKIKNAQAAGKKTLKTRFTKMDNSVVEILETSGFIKKGETKGKLSKRIIEVDLVNKRALRGLRFLSKPSLRVYVGYKELKVSKGGRGLIVLSTSKGLMTSLEAKRKKLGGQLLFEIW